MIVVCKRFYFSCSLHLYICRMAVSCQTQEFFVCGPLCDLSEQWLLRRRDAFDKLLSSSELLKFLKTDVKGLGYTKVGLLRTTSQMEQDKKRKGIGGFGMGVLEEEEEYDVYGDKEMEEPPSKLLPLLERNETASSTQIQSVQEDEIRFVPAAEEQISSKGHTPSMERQEWWIR